MQSPFPLLLLDAKGTGALYGHVDVLVIHVLPEVHGGMSLRHADHGLEVSHCDGHAVADGALLAQVRVHLPHPANCTLCARAPACRVPSDEQLTVREAVLTPHLLVRTR